MFDYDVIIVGAGPSGLLAAYYLTRETSLKILMVDRGRMVHERICPSISTDRCINCQPCNNVHGFGGAGGFYGDTLYFTPAGEEFSSAKRDIHVLLDEVERIFKFFGPLTVAATSEERAGLLKKCQKLGFGIKSYSDLYSAGLETSINITNKMTSHLEGKGVEFRASTKVESINLAKNSGFRVRMKLEEERRCRYLILAVGKGGHNLVTKLKRLGIGFKNPQPYFGVRVETSSKNFEPLAVLGRDPKLYLYRNRDKIKTHCTTINGFVVCCKYDDFTLVDGFAFSENRRHSSNTSFNVITRVNTPIDLGKSLRLISRTNEMGKGKPLLQGIDDLLQGRPTKNPPKTIEPTLKSVTLGDINSVYPPRVMNNIRFFLKKLCRLIPIEKEALVYAPVAEWIHPKIEVDQFFQTSLRGLYVIGDGSGYTQGVVAACVTGVLAASSIARSEEGL